MSSPFDSIPPTLALPPEDPEEARMLSERREAMLEGPVLPAEPELAAVQPTEAPTEPRATTSPEPPPHTDADAPGSRSGSSAGRTGERAPLENRYSWSKSRADIFGGCQRRYYLHYYAYWGGWDESAPPRQRRLYVLRRLSSKEQWAGVAVHEAIARALLRLSRGRRFEITRTLEETRLRMRAEFRGSREGLYWRVRKGFGLVEHEYGDPITNEQWKANWDLVERCLRGFADSPAFARIEASDLTRWKPIDKLDSFQVDGVDVWAAPDFAYFTADDRLEIIDWKTGAARDTDKFQLAGYAAFAEAKWGVPPERVTATLAYLARGETTDVPIDAGAVARFRDEARASMARMRATLADPAKNVAGPEDSYPRTEERWRCRGCSFRSECWEGGRVPADDDATSPR